MSDRLVIGIDAGGTKTALRAERGIRAPLALEGPGINLRRDGLDHTTEVLASLVRETLDAYGGAARTTVCAGISGASSDTETVAAHLRTALAPGTDVLVHIVHDAEIALDAAFDTASGIVLIAGTGSIVYGRRRDGSTLRAGGWGFRLGDDGSGTALGRAALRAVAAALDGGPLTRLRKLIADTHGIDSMETLLAWTYTDTPSLAGMAPLLLQAAAAGDEQAGDLLHDETDTLAQQTAWLARRAGSQIERRVALLGGLMSEAPYHEALVGALAHRLPGWFVARCEQEPVEGALRRARRLVNAR